VPGWFCIFREPLVDRLSSVSQGDGCIDSVHEESRSLVNDVRDSLYLSPHQRPLETFRSISIFHFSR
jgi:hypothetical protein